MLVYSANVRHNPVMLPRHARHDFRLARRWMGSGMGLAGFCEIQSRLVNYDRLLRQVFPVDRWAVFGARTECSVVVDLRSWKVHDRRIEVLTHGDSRIPQPTRVLVMVLVEPRWRDDIAPFWFAETHWSNGGYNGGPHKPHKVERRALWDAQHAGTADEFGSVPESILWGGDLNRTAAPLTQPHEVPLLTNRIDTLRKIERPGQTRFHLEESHVVHGAKSDHDPLFVRLRLEPGR